MSTRKILEGVQTGSISVKEAEAYFRRAPFEELGYAKLDIHRKQRTGYAEVIFCSGKSDEQLVEIFRRIYEAEGEVLGTRAGAEQYNLIRQYYPEATYDSGSRIIKVEKRKDYLGSIIGAL